MKFIAKLVYKESDVTDKFSGSYQILNTMHS